MKIEMFVSWEMRDRKGNIISYKKQPANSLVIGFVDLFYVYINQIYNSGLNTSTVTDTSNLSKTFPPPTTGAFNLVFAALAAAGDALYGPVVGKSTSVVTMIQTALVEKIGHGITSGLLSHGTTTSTAPATTDTTRFFTIQRTFTNNSPGAITVNEVGLYVSARDNVPAQRYIMIDRTLSTQTINVGTSGTLTYTISVTV